MSFWKKVSYELDFQNISRKELAFKINVPVATINRAMERDSNPYAADALRIARALGVSLEYLLEMPDTENDTESLAQTAAHQLELYKKYHSVIELLENLPASKQRPAVKIIEQCAELLAKPAIPV